MKGMYSPPLSAFLYGMAELVLLTLNLDSHPEHKHVTIQYGDHDRLVAKA